ncbi:MAG: OmpP1/FadL family transporter [Candidatus Aminicenantales bacterium]
MRKIIRFLIFFIVFHSFLFNLAEAQLVIGQYEDEAPFRTWNIFGIKTASSFGRGEALIAAGSDCSVALTNPALLTTLPKIGFLGNVSLNAASFFKYSVVNTGPVATETPMYSRYFGFDFIGFSLHLGQWGLALSWGEVENYSRPETRAEYSSQGTLRYYLQLDQKGSLYNVNLSLSRLLFKGISVGIGINYTYGNLNKDITEWWLRDEITITDSKSHKLSGIYLNGGFLCELSRRLRLGAAFRSPFAKNSESHSLLRFLCPGTETDIRIESSSNDTFRQPWIVGVGVSYFLSQNLLLASDVTYFKWSDYSVNYFGEPLKRDFKDVVKASLGLEYRGSFWLFRKKVDSPTRIGFVYDPQPMREPDSSYYYFTLGTGLEWRGLYLDGALLMGREIGSEKSLSAMKIAITLGYMVN